MAVKSEDTLLGPVEIRLLAEQLDVTPTKKFGQNFVHDAGTVRKIASISNLTSEDTVLEVGPGLGSLTLALLETGARVIAVEIDPRLAQQLPATVVAKSEDFGDRLTIVNKDALDLVREDLSDAPTALVANLPYNVAVPILLTALDLFPSIERGVVMVQKEVANRLTADPGSRIYGAPTVKLGWYGSSRKAGSVGRKVFWPEPNVDSGLVAFTRDVAEDDLPEQLRLATFALVDVAFGQRRKMLRASLKGVLGSDLAEVFEVAGIDGSVRPEMLTISDFVDLARGALNAGWRPADAGIDTGARNSNGVRGQ